MLWIQKTLLKGKSIWNKINFYSKINIYPYATKIAGIALYNVAINAALGANAIAGKRASPSFDMAFPISADKGM